MTDTPSADAAPPDDDIEKLKAADPKQLHRAVREEGEDELDRPISSLFWSGLAAGLAACASLVAEGSLNFGMPDAPWRESVVSLGYPIGFLLVILGRLQLFTESTITAMLPVVTKPSWWAAKRTVRLWGIVLVANLIGTALTSLAIARGYLTSPGLVHSMLEVASPLAELTAGQAFVTAIPAGFVIAMVAWVLPNARQQSFWVIFGFTYLIAAAGFTHSIIGSSETFLLMWSGRIDVGHALFVILLPAVFGNLLGGAGLFGLLAHGQVSQEIEEANG